MTQRHENEAESGWLRRGGDAAVDDAGAVLLAWRTAARRTQTEVAEMLDTTQQHLSQIETGRRPVPLELRRKMVIELGIAAEDLGLSSGCARTLVSRDDASPQIAASRWRWCAERRWLNQHRAELAKLAVRLYPPEYRLPYTTWIAPPKWLPGEPLELGSLLLRLDGGPQAAEVDGSEQESAATRPLRTGGLRFERYTSAIKHLSPPALFESRPSYRLLDASLSSRRLEFGLAAYFEKLDVCEATAHEIAAVCMAEGLPSSAEQLRGRLPFRALIGDPFDFGRRAGWSGLNNRTLYNVVLLAIHSGCWRCSDGSASQGHGEGGPTSGYCPAPQRAAHQMDHHPTPGRRELRGLACPVARLVTGRCDACSSQAWHRLSSSRDSATAHSATAGSAPEWLVAAGRGNHGRRRGIGAAGVADGCQADSD